MKKRATPVVIRFQVYMLWRCENDLQGNHEISEEKVKEAKHLSVDNMKSTNHIVVLNIKIADLAWDWIRRRMRKLLILNA